MAASMVRDERAASACMASHQCTGNADCRHCFWWQGGLEGSANLGSRDRGLPDGLTDGLFVLVYRRGVEVPNPGQKRDRYGRRNVRWRGLERAEAYPGELDSISQSNGPLHRRQKEQIGCLCPQGR